MHVRLTEAFLEGDGDTAVDPRRAALHRRLRLRPSVEAPRDALEHTPEPCLGARGDPGATLARTRLAEVRVREAIVRRNHTIDRAERAPRRPSSVPTASLARLEWVRADDTGLRAHRSGVDGFCLSGQVDGTPVRAGRAPSSPRQSRPSSLSVGVDGLIFTTALAAGDDAAGAAHALAERLGHHYEVSVEREDDQIVVRVIRPRAFGAR